jgi:hypothetical protein
LRMRSCIPQKHPPASTARSVDDVIPSSFSFGLRFRAPI